MNSLSYSQLRYITSSLQKDLVGSTLVSIKEKAENQWIFSFEKEQKLLHLLVSIAIPFVRFHLIHRLPSLKKSAFSQKLMHYLSQKKVLSFELLNEDRILGIEFESGFFLLIELFSRGTNLYFLDSQWQILLSAIPIDKKHYTFPPRPTYKEERIDPAFFEKIEEYYTQKEKEFSFHLEKEKLLTRLHHFKKRTLKNLESHEKTAQHCSNWKQDFFEAELLQNVYSSLKKGLKQITVFDWKKGEEKILSLNERLSPKEQLDAFFAKAQKKRNQYEQSNKILEKLKSKICQYEELIEQVSKIENSQKLQEFLQEHTFLLERKKEKATIGLEFFSHSGLKIYVGKNAKQNQELTFRLAKGSDFWLHVSDYSGSHVIISVSKGKEPDFDALLDAANLALYFSRAKDNKEGDILIAQRKYLTKTKDGKVHISKHKKMKIRLDLERIGEIKKRVSP